MILTREIPPLKLVRLPVFEPEGFSTNPSLLRVDGGYLCVVKGVNFDLDEIWLNDDWQAIDRRQPISTAYRLLHLDDELCVLDSFDLDTSDVAPAGVEDLRLFWSGNAIRVCGCILDRDFAWTGRRWIAGETSSRVFVADLVLDRLESARIMVSPSGEPSEKNWAPVCGAAETILLANVETGGFVVQRGAGAEAPGANDLRWRGGWSGSSCLVPIPGGYLAIVHRKTAARPHVYRHMLLAFDEDLAPRRRSAPFSFEGGWVEFCCGLDVGEQDVAIAYGIMDKMATIARFPRQAISDLLRYDASPEALHALEVVESIDSRTLARRTAALDKTGPALGADAARCGAEAAETRKP